MRLRDLRRGGVCSFISRLITQAQGVVVKGAHAQGSFVLVIGITRVARTWRIPSQWYLVGSRCSSSQEIDSCGVCAAEFAVLLLLDQEKGHDLQKAQEKHGCLAGVSHVQTPFWTFSDCYGRKFTWYKVGEQELHDHRVSLDWRVCNGAFRLLDLTLQVQANLVLTDLPHVTRSLEHEAGEDRLPFL